MTCRTKGILNWTKECICNSDKTSFDAIEFRTNSLGIELLCTKCHGIICWWHISTEQIVPLNDLWNKEKIFGNSNTI